MDYVDELKENNIKCSAACYFGVCDLAEMINLHNSCDLGLES